MFFDSLISFFVNTLLSPLYSRNLFLNQNSLSKGNLSIIFFFLSENLISATTFADFDCIDSIVLAEILINWGVQKPILIVGYRDKPFVYSLIICLFFKKKVNEKKRKLL